MSTHYGISCSRTPARSARIGWIGLFLKFCVIEFLLPFGIIQTNFLFLIFNLQRFGNLDTRVCCSSMYIISVDQDERWWVSLKLVFVMLPSVGLGVQHFLRRKKRIEKHEMKADGFFKTLQYTVLYLVFLPLITVERTFKRAYLLLKLAFLEPNNTKLRKKAQDFNKIINTLERIPEGILSIYILYTSDFSALQQLFMLFFSLRLWLVKKCLQAELFPFIYLTDF